MTRPPRRTAACRPGAFPSLQAARLSARQGDRVAAASGLKGWVQRLWRCNAGNGSPRTGRGAVPCHHHTHSPAAHACFNAAEGIAYVRAYVILQPAPCYPPCACSAKCLFSHFCHWMARTAPLHPSSLLDHALLCGRRLRALKRGLCARQLRAASGRRNASIIGPEWP